MCFLQLAQKGHFIQSSQRFFERLRDIPVNRPTNNCRDQNFYIYILKRLHEQTNVWIVDASITYIAHRKQWHCYNSILDTITLTCSCNVLGEWHIAKLSLKPQLKPNWGLRLALSSLNPSRPPTHPPTRESILQLNSSVTMIQFRPTRCNLSPINLRALCWAKFSFNFIKPTINPTKLISSLRQPKRS